METEYPLYTLLIEVTKKCNAACDQCGSRCDINSEEFLTKEQIVSAFRDIKENLGTYTMLNVTGGEPLMRNDLFEIMGSASEMGFDWGMVTNGSLITDEVIEKMRLSGMKTITMSLDGLKETHDSLRHLPGSYDRIIKAIGKLRKADFLDHIQVTFTANKRNVFEFEKLYAILNKLTLDSIRVSFIDPIGRALDNSELLLSREEIIYFTSLVNKYNSKPNGTKIVWGCPHFLGNLLEGRRFKCFAGIYTASILFNGDIYVCPNVERRDEYVQGNILKDSFSQIWKSGFTVFRERKLPDKCYSCIHKNECKGDSFHTLDHDHNEPLFCYTDLIEKPDAEEYKNVLFKRYPNTSFYEISAGEESRQEILIEPEAFGSIRQYFHLGKKSPQSMFEQQMALVGFDIGNMSVVRYVIPCDGALRADDNAVFSKRILKTVDKELKIINNNYWKSSDRDLRGCEPDGINPMRFLGFIHSHPIQPDLQYSTGDDAIHMKMLKRFGSYIGILVHPETSAMGAYYGEKLLQAKLIVPEV